MKMGGGFALRNISALQQVLNIIAPGTDVAETVADGNVIDRKAYGRAELLRELRVIVALNFTTASGAGGDEVDVTLNVNVGDDSAGDDSVLATKTVSLTVDDDDEAKVALLTFDIDLISSLSERYVMIDCTVAPGTGAPTLSAATATVVGVIMPNNDQPRVAYEKGAVETIAFAAA